MAERSAAERAALHERAAALGALFPDLGAVEPLTAVAEGFRSSVVETASGVVFRIAKNAEARAGHERELRLLPALAPRLPARVPEPRWHARSTPAFPFGLIGYEKLPGIHPDPDALRRLDAARLARSLAELMAALHDFPVDEALLSGALDGRQPLSGLARLRDRVLPTLRARLERAEYARVASWWQEILNDPHVRVFPAALCHSDLWYENLLVNEASEVCGVLDFECCQVGEPAVDLAVQLYLGGSFAAKVVAAYAATAPGRRDHFAHRLWRQWELRELDGVRYSVEHDDPDELDDSIAKLRSSPLLAPERWESTRRALKLAAAGDG